MGQMYYYWMNTYDYWRAYAKISMSAVPDNAVISKIEYKGELRKPGIEYNSNKKAIKQKIPSRLEIMPDPFGNYTTNPKALPPGLENVPLITVAYIENGELIGGFTWAIREK